MPVKRNSIIANARTEAAASTVFALLKDGSTWSAGPSFAPSIWNGRDLTSDQAAVRRV
jgi:hypothetical protein